MSDLKSAEKIQLVRCPNGWVAHRHSSLVSCDGKDLFVFCSTESLARQLVELIGKSGWEVSALPRDEKGHFVSPKL